MQFGQGWDDKDPDHAPEDLDATIAEIRRQNADIVHLQEVEHAREGGGQTFPPPNYTRLLAAFPEYHGHFSYPPDDPRELPFGIGLAILSRSPLRSTWTEVLPSPRIEFDFYGVKKTPTDRILIGAETDAAGRAVRLLNVHLLALFMLKSDSRAHPAQRERLAAHLRALGDTPAILTGDFNIRDHAGLAAQFAAEGFATTQTSAITWRRQPYVLDHVFHNSPLLCVRSEVIPTPTSDHHMLVADFAWRD